MCSKGQKGRNGTYNCPYNKILLYNITVLNNKMKIKKP